MTGILRKTISYPFKAANKLWKVAWYRGRNQEHQLIILQDLYSQQRRLEQELNDEPKPEAKELGTQNFLQKLVARNSSQNSSKRQELINLRRQVNRLSKYLTNSSQLELQKIAGGKFTLLRSIRNLGLHSTQKTLYHTIEVMGRTIGRRERLYMFQDRLGDLSDFRRNAIGILNEMKKNQEKQGTAQYAAALALKTQELKETLNEILDKKRRGLALQIT